VISAAALALVPGAAPAATLTCGQTITEDTVLENDLLDCPGHGIFIAANDVDLDLNGHVVDGIGSTAGTGVLWWDSSDGSSWERVTVRNGTIRQFGLGVAMLNDDNVLRSVTLDQNGRGAFLTNGSRNVIADSTIAGSAAEGVDLDWLARDNRITANTITGNRHGIHADVSFIPAAARGNVITKNRITGNRVDGIHFDHAIGDTLIEGNTFSGNADDGIDLVNGETPQRLGANSAVANGDVGIAVASPGGAVLAEDLGGNQAQGNGSAAQCTGIACDRSGRVLFGDPVHGPSFSQMSGEAKRASPFVFAYGAP
jgi:parallel beta-helix repeat protein